MIAFIGEAPLYIALHNGYFREQGLNVSTRFNAAGKTSLDDLMAHRADIVTAADTPLVYLRFQRDDFAIVAAITHTDAFAGAVANRARGIKAPADLKGKRVGLYKGTASDYLLDQFLSAHRMRHSDIEQIDLNPSQLVEALSTGAIDALFSWEPHVRRAMIALGPNAYRLPTAGMKTLDWFIVVRKDYAQENPDLLQRFLAALRKAVLYIQDNREAAKELLVRESGLASELIDSLWDEVTFDLNLSESMLINMEDQARWAIRHGKVDAQEVPDFLQVIDFRPLETLHPESITVIR